MKKTLVAATAALMLAGAATTASATTFAGTWTATYNSSDSTGLPITINNDSSSPANGSFTSTHSFFFNTDYASLFEIETPESFFSTINDHNNTNNSPFTLSLTFTQPGSGSTNPISGTTQLIEGRFSDSGTLTWSNNGNATANLGSAGVVNVHLSDVTFGCCAFDSDDNWAGTEYATFSLSPPTTSAVPEPMSWALMLAGFFGMGAAMRASRRRTAFTAA